MPGKAGGTGGGTREDPAEKISRMIREGIEAAMGERERKDTEAKDPWARIEGLIDRTIAKHFNEFAKGLEDGESSGGTGKQPKDEGEGGGGDLITELFGGGRGR